MRLPFQRFMNDIFSDLLDVHVIIYLDDILVYSDDPTEHTKHVHEVLRRLRKHGLFARPDKCHFSEDSVEYWNREIRSGSDGHVTR